MADKITIGIADMKMAKGEGMLVTYALGSCIGICLHDPALKLGALADYGAHKDLLKELLLFWSSKEGGNTTLAAYKDRMPEDQPFYYYACGESVEKIAKLPQVERVLDKGYEILYCTEDVDDFVMKGLREIDGKEFKSVTEEDALPQTEEERRPPRRRPRRVNPCWRR